MHDIHLQGSGQCLDGSQIGHGHPPPSLRLSHPSDCKGISEKFLFRLNKSGQLGAGEWCVRVRDGAEVRLEVSHVTLAYDDGMAFLSG